MGAEAGERETRWARDRWATRTRVGQQNVRATASLIQHLATSTQGITMTETTPPQWGASQPSAGAPVPPGVPAQPGAPIPPGTPAPAATPEQPAKSGGGRRIISIVAAVVVLGAIGVFRFVLPAIEDSKWKEGACIDYYPAGLIEFDIDPNVVGCTDDAAKSKIVGVFGSDATIEENCVPLGAFASVERGDKTYCIVEV